MFQPSTRQERTTLKSTSNVTFSKRIALSEGITGTPSLLATNSEVTGFISDKSMAHGTMKVVFEVCSFESSRKITFLMINSLSYQVLRSALSPNGSSGQRLEMKTKIIQVK